MTRILIVEDEPAIVVSLEEDFRRQGYETAVATDGVHGIERGKTDQWDLILLDVMLPKVDGFDVCAALRRAGVQTPIILLTARAQEAEKILGLDAGADDYVTKPFSMRELRARVRAQLRRGTAAAGANGATAGNGANGASERRVRFGDCEVDLDRAELRKSGALVEITAQEFRLLSAFLRQPGRVLSCDQLIDAAWGAGMAITDRTVDTHIFNLRRKIERVPAEPAHLVGVRGLGYRFDVESPDGNPHGNPHRNNDAGSSNS